MKAIEFTSKRGTKLQGTISMYNDCTSLLINNGNFHLMPDNSLKSYNYEGIKGNVAIIEVSKEETERIKRFMYPNRINTTYLANYKKVDYSTYCILTADGISTCKISSKADVFKAAHQLAKSYEGNYRACFALALKQVYASQK